MLTLGPLAFASPWVLLALLALPLIWWLLRVTPPLPRRIDFPPVRILRELQRREDTPEKTPLWLLIMRLALAALIILALAHPVLNPGGGLTGTGPVLLVVDDGWTAAAGWQKRSETMVELADQAARQSRPVMVLTTAPEPGGAAGNGIRLMGAVEARALVETMQPKPWPGDHRLAAEAVGDLAFDEAVEAVWLSDGLDDGAAADLAGRLLELGTLRVIADPPHEGARALLPPVSEGALFRLRVLRPDTAGEELVQVRASAEQGQVLAQVPLVFADGAREAEGVLDIPVELRNRLERLEIENEDSAGAVVLLDERWRRRPVGLVSGGPLETAQPLLSDLYYLERALTPFSDVRSGSITELLDRGLAAIVLADVGVIVGPERAALESWLEGGGVLIRFAGPKLAENVDTLIPVRLRQGGRTLGGALSWAQPARLAPFDRSSPFYGLAVPDDVLIARQVLAEPALDLGPRTWARLNDGTPLVTAERRGKGWLTLFHTSANTTWTNLPISLLFVEMLQRIVHLSVGVEGGESSAPLQPYAMLDAFGRPADPPPTARPVATAAFAETEAGPDHPPGFYGTESARRALNVTTGLRGLEPVGALPDEVVVEAFSGAGELDLKPWLLTAALLLALADLVVSLGLRGLLPVPLRSGMALVLLGLLIAPGRPAGAQPTDDDFVLAAVRETRLAYVLTGQSEADEMSRAGLLGLSRTLARRTSVEPGDPIGIDLEMDEIIFFPILYWPMVAEQRGLSDRALAKLDDYMKTGGTVVFDTRDQESAALLGGTRTRPGTRQLRRILRKLDLPPLIPVPHNHVLTKAFYLIQEFPGRWAGGKVWVVRHPGGVNDGVSSIVIGGNDWAAAWAIDEDGQPIAAAVPGGFMQRETAFRFGINLVMYALTGNYKADQVHVPAILERLGQ